MLVGLHGPAQSGKDSVYGILRTFSFGEGPLGSLLVRRDAFADRLKISAARALGYSGSHEQCIEFCNTLKTEGRYVAVLDEGGVAYRQISGREYLQLYGTEAHRDVFGQQFWVKAVLPDGYPSEIEEKNTLLVVTDVRFPNEAERVRECGGQVWMIDRPMERIAESSHASETPLPDELIDHTIRNHGDLDFLQQEVETATRRLFQCSSL